MQIKLQSTVGNFQSAFMRKLPLIEQAMVARGLDPADFVSCKDRATPSATIPLIGRFFYDYTVFVGTERFIVTEPNDRRFLQIFLQPHHRSAAEDAADGRHAQPRDPLGPTSDGRQWQAWLQSLAARPASKR